MRTSRRIIIGAATLGLVLVAGSVPAQDPIVVDQDPDGQVSWTHETTNDSTPGLPTQIRADVVTERYTMQVDTAGGRIEVESVTFKLKKDERFGRRRVNIVARNGKLEFEVGGDAIGGEPADQCKPHDGECTGIGMPANMYGQLKGKIKAYEKVGGTAIVVEKVMIRCESCAVQQQQAR